MAIRNPWPTPTVLLARQRFLGSPSTSCWWSPHAVWQPPWVPLRIKNGYIDPLDDHPPIYSPIFDWNLFSQNYIIYLVVIHDFMPFNHNFSFVLYRIESPWHWRALAWPRMMAVHPDARVRQVILYLPDALCHESAGDVAPVTGAEALGFVEENWESFSRMWENMKF